MEKSKEIKFNFFKFLNTGIVGPLISFAVITSMILYFALFYAVGN